MDMIHGLFSGSTPTCNSDSIVYAVHNAGRILPVPFQIPTWVPRFRCCYPGACLVEISDVTCHPSGSACDVYLYRVPIPGRSCQAIRYNSNYLPAYRGTRGCAAACGALKDPPSPAKLIVPFGLVEGSCSSRPTCQHSSKLDWSRGVFRSQVPSNLSTSCYQVPTRQKNGHCSRGIQARHISMVGPCRVRA